MARPVRPRDHSKKGERRSSSSSVPTKNEGVRHRPAAAAEAAASRTQAERQSERTEHRPAEAPADDETTIVDDEIDVWPNTDVLEEESRASPVEESGLSVDPDDLGRNWLNQATEQNNFESSEAEQDSGIHVIFVPVKPPG